MRQGIHYTEESIKINEVPHIRMIYRYFMNDKVLCACAYILRPDESEFKSEIRSKMCEQIKNKVKMLR